MMTTNTSNCQIDNPTRPLNRAAIAPDAWARSIVNIAGIGPGDAVIRLGAEDNAVDAAVSRSGAHIQHASTDAGTGRRSFYSPQTPALADAAIWAIDGFGQPALEETLAAIRKSLRLGGRLVAWALPDDSRGVQAWTQRLQRLIAGAGFTSIIGSPLPTDNGEIAVATGIYVSCIHGVDCPSAAHGRMGH